MQASEGQLATWSALARALEQFEPAEVELLPDMAQASMQNWDRIRNVPGAFDFLAAVQSMAATLYPVVHAGMVFAAPKLFDATLDIGKDSIKKLLERRLAVQPATASVPGRIDAARLHEVIRTAALERRISLGNAEIIANAVLAQLATEKGL